MIADTNFSYLIDVYTSAKTVLNDDIYTTVNELCDQVPALRPEVLKEAANWLITVGEFSGNKIVTEEDKGAILVGAIALQANKPLAVARWYPYQLPSSTTIKVKMHSEYREGDLYLNGINVGDEVTIVEDTISSGGTIIALVDAIRKAGGEVIEILSVVEKIGFGGVEKVRKETGIQVKTGIGISVDKTGTVQVLAHNKFEEARY